MENNKKFNVNIYYNDDEVNAAFSQDISSFSKNSKVHIFTKNPSKLNYIQDYQNVELHSAGGLWDRLKAWIAGQEQFQEQFSALNISLDDRERYRNIILNGGTIVLSSSDPKIDTMFASPEEAFYANASNEEVIVNADPDLTASSQLEENDAEPESTVNLLEDVKNIIEDALPQSLENKPVQDASSNPKNDLTTEATIEHDVTLNVDTNKESFPHLPDEAKEHPGDMMAHLNTYETLRDDTPDSAHQLETLENDQQVYHETIHNEAFSNDDSNNLAEEKDFIQHVSPDESLSTFDVLANRNVPTDSTDSVSDAYLIEELIESSPIKSEEDNLSASQQNNEERYDVEGVTLDDLLDELENEQTNNYLSDDVLGDASEYRRHDSP